MSHRAADVVLAWVAVAPLISRLAGPRWGALASALGGYALLPQVGFGGHSIVAGLRVGKESAIGLGLLMGLLLSDRPALARLRPRWVDLAMGAYLAVPLASWAANRFAEGPGMVAQCWASLTSIGLPYLAGRAALADRDAPRRFSEAVVAAGLASIPVCAFEIVAGPRRYLLGLLYGIGPHWNMVERLGGYRPEGFQGNGIELACWMALATSVAAWAWLDRGWRLLRLPGWSTTSALLATTIACRGVYGYLALATGLSAVLAGRLLNTRWALVALALVPPAYMAARTSGEWDGREMIELAGRAGNSATVGYRVEAESRYIEKVRAHGLAFGFGPLDSSIYNWWAKAHLWPDGRWIHVLRGGGVVGLIAYEAAILIVPIALFARFFPGHPRRPTPWPRASGPALVVVLLAIDDLQNMAYSPAGALAAGSIAGFFLAGPAAWESRPRPRWLPSWREFRRAASARPLLWLTVLALLVIEALGALTREPPGPPPPAPAASMPR